MQVETLNDIIDWSREVHQYLAERVSQDAAAQQNERAKLLMNYLADHERTLSQLLQRFEDTADAKALNTWCYEFIHNRASKLATKQNRSFSEMGTEEMIASVMAKHELILELYRHLAEQADTASVKELLDQLISLEAHESMRMVQGANRLEDI